MHLQLQTEQNDVNQSYCTETLQNFVQSNATQFIAVNVIC